MDDAHEPEPQSLLHRRLKHLLGAVTLLLLAGVAILLATTHWCDGPGEIEQTLQSSPSVEARRQAAICLHHEALEDYPRGHAAAADALRDPDPQVRLSAIRYLQWRVDSLPPELLAVTLALLDDPEPGVSDAAARTLGHVKAQTLPHLPALIELLDHGTPQGRRSAAFLMGMLFALAPQKVAAAIPALDRAMQSSDPELRNKAVWSLREFGPNAALATPTLARLLDDPKETTRGMAVATLGKIGAPAIPALVQVLADGGGRAREKAAGALWLMALARVPEVAPVVVDLLIDPDPKVRSMAEAALSSLGASADPALLARIHGDDRLSVAALRALGRRRGSPAGADARAALLAGLKHDHWQVRTSSSFGLARGKPYPDAAPHLLRLLADHDAEVRAAAADLIGRFGGQAGEALPALERALSDAAPRVRIGAALAVARIAPTRGSAMAQRILSDIRAENLRGVALAMIKSIAIAERSAGRPPLWWAVPLAWALELVVLLCGTIGWFLLCARFPRRRPRSRVTRVAYVLVAAAVPAGIWGVAIYYGLKGFWVTPCLPEFQLLLLPFRWSVITSAAFLCLMAGLLLLMRKAVPNDEEEPQSTPVLSTDSLPTSP